MRIWNCKDPDISFFLVPWYVVNGQSIAQIGADIYERLRDNPEDTFCSLIIEKNRCIAFIVAYYEQNVTFILQARATPGCEYGQLVFDGLILWSQAKGARCLQACVKRPKAFIRKWGFRKTKTRGLIERKL